MSKLVTVRTRSSFDFAISLCPQQFVEKLVAQVQSQEQIKRLRRILGGSHRDNSALSMDDILLITSIIDSMFNDISNSHAEIRSKDMSVVVSVQEAISNISGELDHPQKIQLAKELFEAAR